MYHFLNEIKILFRETLFTDLLILKLFENETSPLLQKMVGFRNLGNHGICIHLISLFKRHVPGICHEQEVTNPCLYHCSQKEGQHHSRLLSCCKCTFQTWTHAAVSMIIFSLSFHMQKLLIRYIVICSVQIAEGMNVPLTCNNCLLWS